MPDVPDVKGKTILVVQAHPDDADFYCGGTMARFAHEGARIVYLICTDGSKGSLDPSTKPKRLAKARAREQLEANKMLGVAETRFLGFKDLECPRGLKLREKLVRHYREIRPDIIMTFDPWKQYEYHPDHTVVGSEALYARLAAKLPLAFPEHLEKGLEVVDDHELLLFKTDHPDCWVDIEEFFAAKRQALLCHTSQFGGITTHEDANGLLSPTVCAHPATGKLSEAFKRVSIQGFSY